MRKSYIITGIVIGLSFIALFLFIKLSSGDKTRELNFGIAERGKLEFTVSGTGELLPERSVEIKGPKLTQYRNIRMAGLKINDIIPEGTEVRQGDYIATLDRTVFENNLTDELAELKTLQDSVTMRILDTAVVLSTLRDDIRNQYFVVEEGRITVQQSKYEPPATIRRAELELDKSIRLMEQKKSLYSLQKRQTGVDIKNLKVNLNIQQRTVDDLNNILAQFIIKAPADGLLVYKTDRSGVKIKSGSTLDPFNPVVATLPDLSSMFSRMYVSEVEVNKIKTGQPVQIRLDALENIELTGHVASKANIGEQLPNSDSKMFEVFIRVKESDPRLMPSMTTDNRIITKTFDNVTFVPVESVQAGEDSIPFVYTREGSKQIIVPGESNEKSIIVEKGVSPGTILWLRTPDDPEKFRLAGRDLISAIRELEKLKRMKFSTSKSTELISDAPEKSDTLKTRYNGGSGGTSGGY